MNWFLIATFIIVTSDGKFDAKQSIVFAGKTEAECMAYLQGVSTANDDAKRKRQKVPDALVLSCRGISFHNFRTLGKP